MKSTELTNGQKVYAKEYGAVREGIVVEVEGFGLGIDWGEGANFNFGMARETRTEVETEITEYYIERKAASERREKNKQQIKIQRIKNHKKCVRDGHAEMLFVSHEEEKCARCGQHFFVQDI